MNFVRRLGKWTARRSRTTRSFWAAAVTGASFYFGNFLSEAIAKAISLPSPWGIVFHAVFFITLLVLVVFAYKIATDALNSAERDMEEERSTMSHAYKLCDRLIIDRIKRLEDKTGNGERVVAVLGPSVKEIERVVQAAYQTFEAAFGKASLSEDRTDFEVTFMTKSLRDGQITIPAAANKDGRLPRSMELRKHQPNIYDSSVTADLYRAPSQRITIVEDTYDPATDYKELYPGQRSRIRSSIVFPILSSRNRLLGTLVVHCDRKGFFAREKEKYWGDLLEVFGKRIALEALGMAAMWEIERRGEAPF